MMFAWRKNGLKSYKMQLECHLRKTMNCLKNSINNKIYQNNTTQSIPQIEIPDNQTRPRLFQFKRSIYEQKLLESFCELSHLFKFKTFQNIHILKNIKT